MASDTPAPPIEDEAALRQQIHAFRSELLERGDLRAASFAAPPADARREDLLYAQGLLRRRLERARLAASAREASLAAATGLALLHRHAAPPS